MDVKMGQRTYMESEAVNKKKRMDLLQKMVKVAPVRGVRGLTGCRREDSGHPRIDSEEEENRRGPRRRGERVYVARLLTLVLS